ncbi:MAG: tyrosine recombinase XerC [Clostridia bacterium]|nr:tyrosine recombinase XerC [Clostridia bacterium]
MKKDELRFLPDTVKGYLDYQTAVRNKSDLTVLEYASDLRTFFRWCLMSRDKSKETKSLNEYDISGLDEEFMRNIRLNDLYSFLAYCQRDLKNSGKTRARKASTLRGFFKFLKAHGIIEKNPAEDLDAPRAKKALPKYLTLDSSIALLDAVEGTNYERDYCIITLFLNCGLRLSELVGLNLKSIGIDGSLRILGKGNKERMVYLNKACTDALNSYLAVRPRDGVKDREALFISRHKTRISPKTVQHIVKTYLEKAGLEGYSTHKLRHTAATLMYQHGDVDVMLLKELLGHESLATTQIYTHVANEQIRSAINANPLAQVKKEKKSKK